jgi:chromosome segregation protein
LTFFTEPLESNLSHLTGDLPLLKLQKILIQGFKSFADKTELVFDGMGVVTIVGPNGCGKSNISDAIAWVLGEQSAKSLRGGRMEDVIFNGTRTRLPLGLAEVTLTLVDPETLKETGSPVSDTAPENGNEQNAQEASDSENLEEMSAPIQVPDGSAPSPGVAIAVRKKKRAKFQHKPGELVVSRRLYRSGDSEYMINGRQVRLRDVQDIFMGTGLGPDSYAIIEQGRVGLILSSKPSDRRSIIEEAAAITKFKSKRKLAESKLEQARQNLLRVNDITEEVSKQLGSLKRQAAKARRYRELRERMREIAQILFYARALALNASMEQTEQQLTQLTDDYQQKRWRLEEGETLYHRRNSELFNLEEQLKQLRQQLSELSLEMERARQRVQFQNEQLRELDSRSAENAIENDRLEQQGRLFTEEIREKNELLQQITESFVQMNTRHEAEDARHQALQQRVLEMELARDDLRSELLNCVGKAATLQNQLLQLDDLDDRLKQTQTRLAAERIEAITAQEQLMQAQHSAERQQQEEERQLSDLRERIASLSETLSALKEEDAQSHKELLELKERHSSNAHRLDSLQELATHHAYSTEAVRLLLSVAVESREGGFRTPGILADLIEVEPAYETLVEAFLRQELEYVLVEAASTAFEGIALLNKTETGRSTFLVAANGLALATDNTEEVLTSLMAQDPSLIPLRNVLKIPPDYEAAARDALPQLDRTLITSSADRAQELAQQHPRLVFLSSDGTVLQGRLISGGGKASGGHLSLKREIRQLERNTKTAYGEIKSIEERIERLSGSLQAKESELSAVRIKNQDLEKLLVGSELLGKQIQNDVGRARQSQAQADLELRKIEDEKRHNQTKRLQHQEEIAAAEGRKAEIEHRISADQEELRLIKENALQDARKLSELRSELAAFRERKLAAEAELNRLTASLQDCQERVSRLDSQKNVWAEQKKSIDESIRQVEEVSFSQAVRKASLEAEIRSHENSLAETRSTQLGLEEELKLHRGELEEVQNRRMTLEIDRARLGSDFSHLQETCSKELGLRLDEIHLEVPPQFGDQELLQLDTDYLELTNKIDAMGPVNMMALEEHQECEERFQFLSTQRKDLLDSIEDTSAAIKEIDEVCREQFREAFIAINSHFQECFTALFGGGHGEMKLLEEQDELESGIEIIAQPPGKRLQNVLLLSGGEKALTAIALLLAIFKFQPSPFCVLDEVDAPLDEVNNGRYSQMIKSMSLGTQFILITHSKKTMEIADTLYGVTMQEPGISKLVSVQFQ